MKKGFTIIEVLVASLLLGMLVSILTMMFNQSSIAWRTGVASVEDLSDVRQQIAELREEADNAYVWNNTEYHIVGLWNYNGNLRSRAWDVDGGGGANIKKQFSLNDKMELDQLESTISVGSVGSAKESKTYMVNVKSAGPDREFGTFDDIWSYPDEIKE